ncbi:MAG: tape measure protein [Thermodesulfobacteriota bacterium]
MMENKVQITIEFDAKGRPVIKDAQGAVRQLGAESEKAAGKMQRASAASEAMGRSLQSLKSYIGGFIALSAAVKLAMGVFETGRKAEALDRSFKAITGSAAGAAQELAYVKKEADRLGLSYTTLADSYKSLAAAAMGTRLQGQATRDIFTAVNEAASVLGLTADETGGALMALSQMISKGTVSAEELKQQLGERLPGAFQIAARAMNMSTAQLTALVESGRLAAEDFLPKLAAELHRTYGAAAGDTDNATAAVARLENAWTDLKKALSDTGFLDLVISLMKQAADTVKFWADQLGVLIDVSEKAATEKEIQRIKDKTYDTEALITIAEAGMLREPNDPEAKAALDRLNKQLADLNKSLELLGHTAAQSGTLIPQGAWWRRYREGEWGVGEEHTLIFSGATKSAGYNFPKAVRQYADLIESAAKEWGVPAELIAAMMMVESDGRNIAGPSIKRLGGVTAKGLMQFMPGTAEQYGILGREFVPSANIGAGAHYLRDLLDRYGGDLYQALNAYSGGGGAKYVGAVKGWMDRMKAGGTWDTWTEMEKKAKEAAEEQERLVKERKDMELRFTADYIQAVQGRYTFERYQLDLRRAEYEGFIGDKAALDRWYTAELAAILAAQVEDEKKQEEERPRNSRERWDGGVRALRDYADSAGNAAENMENVFTNAFQGLEDALVNFVTTGKLEFTDLVNSIIADLARLMIREAITAPLAAALTSALTGGNVFSRAASLGIGGYGLSSAQGNVFLSGRYIPFGRGGVVTRPTLFQFAQGVGLMGEAGDEGILPLARTSTGDLGVKAAGPAGALNVRIELVNQSGTRLEVSRPQARYDAQGLIVSAVVDALDRNAGGARDAVRRAAYA